MITFPPQLRDATPEKQAVMHEARRCMNRLKMELGQLNMLTKRFVYNNGMEIICQYCFGKEDIFVKIPPVVVGTLEVEQEEVLVGIILHPRSGNIDPVEYYIGRYDAESGTHFDTYTLNGIKGGWTNGTTPLTTSYLYPLVDEDNASFMITANEPADGDFVGTSGNYGNLHWYNGDPDDPKFLSWKGPPNRHIECSDLVNIPGTSTHFCWSQHGVTGDAPRYTAFSTNVYQNGEAVIGPKFSWPYRDELKGQTLILGAAIGQADGDIYVVTASDQRFAKLYYRVFSNGYVLETDDKQKADSYATEHPGVTLTYSIDLPRPEPYYTQSSGWHTPGRGKYIQIWNNNGPINGWKLLFQSECEDNSINLPWFADATGTGFTCSNGATISPTGINEAYFPKGSFSQTPMIQTTIPDDANGSSTITFSGGAVSCSGVGYGYHEATIESMVRYSASSTMNKVIGGKILKDFAGDTIEELGIDPEVSISGPSVLSGTGTYPNRVTSAGQSFFATGGTPPYSWTASFAGARVDDDANSGTFVTSGGDKPCGMGTITVTDACGKTASLDVKMPNGRWVAAGAIGYVPDRQVLLDHGVDSNFFTYEGDLRASLAYKNYKSSAIHSFIQKELHDHYFYDDSICAASIGYGNSCSTEATAHRIYITISSADSNVTAWEPPQGSSCVVAVPPPNLLPRYWGYSGLSPVPVGKMFMLNGLACEVTEQSGNTYYVYPVYNLSTCTCSNGAGLINGSVVGNVWSGYECVFCLQKWVC